MSNECVLCSEEIEPNRYAVIESDSSLKYHPTCLHKWFSKTDIGMISRQRVKEYNIYNGDTLDGIVGVEENIRNKLQSHDEKWESWILRWIWYMIKLMCLSIMGVIGYKIFIYCR